MHTECDKSIEILKKGWIDAQRGWDGEIQNRLSVEKALAISEEDRAGIRETLREANQKLDEQWKELETERAARSIAESRVSDLHEALQIERSRFDKSIEYQRETEAGIRSRFGLEKQDSIVRTGLPQPVSSRREPFSTLRGRLERADAKKHADSLEQHYQNRIKKIEEDDMKVADGTNSNAGTRSEGSIS